MISKCHSISENIKKRIKLSRPYIKLFNKQLKKVILSESACCCNCLLLGNYHATSQISLQILFAFVALINPKESATFFVLHLLLTFFSVKRISWRQQQNQVTFIMMSQQSLQMLEAWQATAAQFCWSFAQNFNCEYLNLE